MVEPSAHNGLVVGSTPTFPSSTERRGTGVTATRGRGLSSGGQFPQHNNEGGQHGR